MQFSNNKSQQQGKWQIHIWAGSVSAKGLDALMTVPGVLDASHAGSGRGYGIHIGIPKINPIFSWIPGLNWCALQIKIWRVQQNIRKLAI